MCNIPPLCLFGSPAQQNNHRLPRLPEINPIPRSEEKAQFIDPIPQRLAVSEVAQFQPVNPSQNSALIFPASQAVKPCGERLTAPRIGKNQNLVGFVFHVLLVRFTVQFVKAFSYPAQRLAHGLFFTRYGPRAGRWNRREFLAAPFRAALCGGPEGRRGNGLTRRGWGKSRHCANQSPPRIQRRRAGGTAKKSAAASRVSSR